MTTIWPKTIIWPADKPATAMPPVWQRLAGGRLKAVYRNRAELARSLAVLKEAAVQPRDVVALEDLPDYLERENLQIAGPLNWRPHPENPELLTPWLPVINK